MKYWVVPLILAAGWAAPANAEWLRVESRHFIIYSNDREADVREDSERLEQFDQAVRAVRQMDDPKLDSGAKVTVYSVSLNTVQNLAGSSSVYGFYRARAEGSLAFVPRRTEGKGRYVLSADQVFFHEYAHHLMFLSLDSWAPRWFVEGFAEFYATAAFEPGGTVLLGQSPAYRSYGINSALALPLDRMLADDLTDVTGDEYASLYGRGWALTHLLTFEPDRRGQLSSYMQALRRGTDPAKAATDAFGDLKLLNRQITSYANRPTLQSLRVASSALSVGPIEVTRLGPASDKIMPLLVRTKAGVTPATAGPQVEKMRKAAAGFPQDPLALIALAEAEGDAGNHAAAIAASDKLLQIQPRNIDAMMLKANALLTLAAQGKDSDRNRLMARNLAAAANKISPEDPEPLILFYDSFAGGSKAAPDAAFKAIHYALVLAPFDDSLRMKSALAHIGAKQWSEASSTLLPLAHNVHSPKLAKAAKEALAAVKRQDGAGAVDALTRKADAKK